MQLLQQTDMQLLPQELQKDCENKALLHMQELLGRDALKEQV
jgi:hypothetical protein